MGEICSTIVSTTTSTTTSITTSTTTSITTSITTTISTTTTPFDCNVALDNAERAWSQEKKAWCCKNEKKACLFDCDAGWPNWYKGWSDEKKSWCCLSSMGARGCTTSTTQTTTTTTTTTLNAQCTTKSPKKPEAWCVRRCNNSKKCHRSCPNICTSGCACVGNEAPRRLQADILV